MFTLPAASIFINSDSRLLTQTFGLGEIAKEGGVVDTGRVSVTDMLADVSRDIDAHLYMRVCERV